MNVFYVSMITRKIALQHADCSRWLTVWQSLEEKHTLRMVLENTIEDLWKQVQQAQKNYQIATEDHKIAFAVLKAKDEKSAEEISYQMKKLQKIQVTTVTSRVLLIGLESQCSACKHKSYTFFYSLLHLITLLTVA